MATIVIVKDKDCGDKNNPIGKKATKTIYYELWDGEKPNKHEKLMTLKVAEDSGYQQKPNASKETAA
jgi:hypothetical protein